MNLILIANNIAQSSTETKTGGIFSVQLLLNKLGLHELLPASALTQVGGQFFCTASRPTYALCTLFTSLYVGFSDYPLDRVSTIIYAGHNLANKAPETFSSCMQKFLLHSGVGPPLTPQGHFPETPGNRQTYVLSRAE